MIPEKPPVSQSDGRKRIGLLFGTLNAGGIQEVMATLSTEFTNRGHTVDILVRDQSGPVAAKLPATSEIFTLEPGNVLLGRILACLAYRGAIMPVFRGILPSRVKYSVSLMRYINRYSPDGIISAGIENTILAVTAKSHSNKTLRLVATEHGFKEYDKSLSRFYDHANAVVSVSNSLKAHVEKRACFDISKLRTIYNPVEPIAPEPKDPPHPWLHSDQPPVILYVGRLVPVKNLELLLRAFSLLRQDRQVRMLIVGGTEESISGKHYVSTLQGCSKALGITEGVACCGFSACPAHFMAHAQVLAISSQSDDFSNVIV